MLNPKDNRLDYGEILSPPEGYELDFAVGTTYSLDLDALVGVTVALGLGEETDSSMMNNPICLLEALRRTSDKIALFCEDGQIHMPSKVTPLYILLEKIVFTVKIPQDSGKARYPSFHPKFWLIRYVNNKTGEKKFRIAVLSRNLTFDRSWDVTYSMDGIAKERVTPIKQNNPLCDFLNYLSELLPRNALNDNIKKKKSLINQLARDIEKVEFTPEESEFNNDFEFIPVGIPGAKYLDNTHLFIANTSDINEADMEDGFHELLIMSPFLSREIIRGFNDRNSKLNSKIKNIKFRLLTRKVSLDKLNADDVSNFEVYTLRDRVIDGESAVSEDDAEKTAEPGLQDLHAKIYITRRYNDISIYLGSLNASSNAINGNIEFMIRLKSNRNNFIEKIVESLPLEGADSPFELTQLKNSEIAEEKDITNEINSIIKNLIRQNPSAQVIKDEDTGLYSVKIHCAFVPNNNSFFNIQMKPLLSEFFKDYASEIVFDRLSEFQLSDFYAISVTACDKTIERVIVIPTDGLPQEREKNIVGRVVNSRDNFYRYVSFLLENDSIISVLESNRTLGEKSNINISNTEYNVPGLYEKMLQTAASDKKKFQGISYLMNAVSEDNVVPEDFKKLYEIFVKVVGK